MTFPIFNIIDLITSLAALSVCILIIKHILQTKNITEEGKNEIEKETNKTITAVTKGETFITKIPTTNQELEYYDIPIVQGKYILESDEVKAIRAKDEEYDIDLDFNTDDLKEEDTGEIIVKKGNQKKESIKNETSKSKAEGPQNEGPQKVGSQKEKPQSKNVKKKDKEKPTFIKRQIE